ncbi:hypothetical protein V1514DRAFT_339742 [Lipomyces japonicus]|uniref:uncharacterized protein n=1 Tax=Lipomyces japonicus TaxID=56871 RepID=UPI0034CD7255
MSLKFFPAVKPSAIALGTVFSHGVSIVLAAPIFGTTFQRARVADTPEEYLKSKEAASAAAIWGTSLAAAAAKAYAVSVILQSTGTLTNKGAIYIGSLLFAVSSGPALLANIFTEQRPGDYIFAKLASSLLDNIGLSFILNSWGTRPEFA